MRATILPKAIILTKAHRAAVSIMAMGSIVALANPDARVPHLDLLCRPIVL